ncbi:MAG: HEPN domain-containing protein [Candidatus Aenigmatarchaeota archaeon]
MKEIIDVTKRWIAKADKDLNRARILLDYRDFEGSLFNSQQAAEKFLKAFLVFHNKPIKKTHNIKELIKECSLIDKEFLKLYELRTEILFPLGVKIRYPIDVIVSEEEAKEAIEIAEKVKEFVIKKLKEKGLEI